VIADLPTINLSPKGYLPAQEAARRLVEDPTGPTWVLLSGGQGSGKSYWAVWELLRLHFINVRHVVENGGTPADVWGMLVSPTHALLRKGLGITLEQILAECGLAGRYSLNKQDGILTFDFGGGIYLFTAEKPDRIISVNVSEAVVDEPGTSVKPDAIQRIPGRLRGPGILRKIVMAGTPEDIVTRQWFYDFIASPEAQAKYGEQGENSRRVVFASTRENCFIADLAGYVAGQESVLTKAQQAAYLDGQFVAFNVGRVYSAFIDRSFENGGHRIPNGHEMLTPPGRGNPLLLSLDFNVDPMCGVVAAPLVRDGADSGLRVLDEIRIPKQGAEEGETPIGRWCKEALERWVRDWDGPVHVYGDATAERANVAASRTGWALVHDHLRPVVQATGRDYYVGVTGSNPREIDRVNTVNAAFERGEVLVAESCLFLRKDLNLVGFKPGTSQIDKVTDLSLTHLSDALGYLICQRKGLLSSRVAGVMPRILVGAVPSVSELYDWGAERRG
jgi:hypothetical protein